VPIIGFFGPKKTLSDDNIKLLKICLTEVGNKVLQALRIKFTYKNNYFLD